MAKGPGKEAGDSPNKNERPCQRYRREGGVPSKTPRDTKGLNTIAQTIGRTKTGGRGITRGADRRDPKQRRVKTIREKGLPTAETTKSKNQKTIPIPHIPPKPGARPPTAGPRTRGHQ